MILGEWFGLKRTHYKQKTSQFGIFGTIKSFIFELNIFRGIARSNNQRGRRERANLNLGGANSNLGRGGKKLIIFW